MRVVYSIFFFSTEDGLPNVVPCSGIGELDKGQGMGLNNILQQILVILEKLVLIVEMTMI